MRPFLAFIISCFLAPALVGQVIVHPKAHAHNDYEHATPLFEALAAGFASIEADVHLVNGELYVSHNAPRLGTAKTLKELYLGPLQKRIKENGGQVYPNYAPPIYLMIDIKTESEATYQVLKAQLADYQEILTHWNDGTVHQGALLVFLSGNRPVETVMKEKMRWVAIDGRPDELDKDYPTELMPVISDRYGKILGWKGEGPIPEKELFKLQALAQQANRQGKKLRFWASPENEAVWQVLIANGIGLIGTDQLGRLSNFLAKP